MDNQTKVKNEIEELLLQGQRLATAWKMQNDIFSAGSERVYLSRRATSQLQREGKVSRNTFSEEDRQLKDMDICDIYQRWYSNALVVIRQLLPNRLEYFVGLYDYKEKRKEILLSNCRIADMLRGAEFPAVDRTTVKEHAFKLFKQQLIILTSAKESFDSSVFEIKQVIQADLLDSEIDAARRLNKNGSACAAGAIAGVVLEKHLNAVVGSHELKVSKNSPGINDYAQKLKDEGVIDFQTCRFIQRLGNLRDLCYDTKGPAIKKEDVEELIVGVDRIIKTVF